MPSGGGRNRVVSVEVDELSFEEAINPGHGNREPLSQAFDDLTSRKISLFLEKNVDLAVEKDSDGRILQAKLEFRDKALTRVGALVEEIRKVYRTLDPNGFSATISASLTFGYENTEEPESRKQSVTAIFKALDDDILVSPATLHTGMQMPEVEWRPNFRPIELLPPKSHTNWKHRPTDDDEKCIHFVKKLSNNSARYTCNLGSGRRRPVEALAAFRVGNPNVRQCDGAPASSIIAPYVRCKITAPSETAIGADIQSSLVSIFRLDKVEEKSNGEVLGQLIELPEVDDGADTVLTSHAWFGVCLNLEAALTYHAESLFGADGKISISCELKAAHSKVREVPQATALKFEIDLVSRGSPSSFGDLLCFTNLDDGALVVSSDQPNAKDLRLYASSSSDRLSLIWLDSPDEESTDNQESESLSIEAKDETGRFLSPTKIGTQFLFGIPEEHCRTFSLRSKKSNKNSDLSAKSISLTWTSDKGTSNVCLLLDRKPLNHVRRLGLDLGTMSIGMSHTVVLKRDRGTARRGHPELDIQDFDAVVAFKDWLDDGEGPNVDITLEELERDQFLGTCLGLTSIDEDGVLSSRQPPLHRPSIADLGSSTFAGEGSTEAELQSAALNRSRLYANDRSAMFDPHFPISRTAITAVKSDIVPFRNIKSYVVQKRLPKDFAGKTVFDGSQPPAYARSADDIDVSDLLRLQFLVLLRDLFGRTGLILDAGAKEKQRFFTGRLAGEQGGDFDVHFFELGVCIPASFPAFAFRRYEKALKDAIKVIKKQTKDFPNEAVFRTHIVSEAEAALHFCLNRRHIESRSRPMMAENAVGKLWGDDLRQDDEDLPKPGYGRGFAHVVDIGAGTIDVAHIEIDNVDAGTRPHVRAHYDSYSVYLGGDELDRAIRSDLSALRATSAGKALAAALDDLGCGKDQLRLEIEQAKRTAHICTDRCCAFIALRRDQSKTAFSWQDVTPDDLDKTLRNGFLLRGAAIIYPLVWPSVEEDHTDDGLQEKYRSSRVFSYFTAFTTLVADEIASFVELASRTFQTERPRSKPQQEKPGKSTQGAETALPRQFVMLAGNGARLPIYETILRKSPSLQSAGDHLIFIPPHSRS